MARIRGTLGAFMMIILNAGILFGYILGNYLKFTVLPYVVIGIVILFFAVFLNFPETPQYLLLKNRIADAEASLKFYRGASKNSSDQLILIEFNSLRSSPSLNNKDDRLQLSDFSK